MFKDFIEDERGISEEVFKLAMIVIVVAAILAILASILKPTREGSISAVNNTVETMNCITGEQLCDTKQGTWNTSTCKCNYTP